jgi:hypothetical protein
VNAEPANCFQARDELRDLIQRYCAQQQIALPQGVRWVFPRDRLAPRSQAQGRLQLPREALVDLDDDDAWLEVCPCDRRWWDLDLYAALATAEGAVGFTASDEASDAPVTRPGGIFVHPFEVDLT